LLRELGHIITIGLYQVKEIGWIGFMRLRVEPVMGSCDPSKEPLGFIKLENLFTEQLLVSCKDSSA
jgi:hypothetical protein